MVLPSIYIIFAALFPSTAALCHRTECSCKPYRDGPGQAADCAFQSRQMMAMKASDFPADLASITMSGGRELRFDLEVFAHLRFLETVTVRGVPKVFVKEHSFANMTSRLRMYFEFTDAASLILEGMSWKSPSGPISVLIARIGQVIIQGQSFARLENFTAIDVSRLELLEKAFYISRPTSLYNERPTTITLERVHIENLARMTFYSSIHQVRLKSSEVKRVHGEAFSAIQIEQVIIENTTLHKVEPAAVSDHTLIHTLTLNNVRIHDLQPTSIVSGLTNLVLTYSKLGTIRTGAINVTVASVLMTGNIFTDVHRRAVVLKQWNSLTISNNTFKKVDREAFLSPLASVNSKAISSEGYLAMEDESVKTHEFNFTGNILLEFTNPAFDFSIRDDYQVLIDNNFFIFNCHCDMSVHVARVIGNDEVAVFQTGLCSVDQTLSRCYQIPQGFTNMWNFTEAVCKVHGGIFCEDVQLDAAVPPQFPNVVSTEENIFEEEDREREVLSSIFAIVVLGMLITMFLSAVMWLGRQNCCTKARRLLLPSTNSFVNRLTRFFSGSDLTPAASISRLSVHEYAELQKKIEDLKTTDDDDLQPLEDKATQTLPEELTQELLQSLKEKLNDPENYSEARDMIEHLYDLIKVEESCNKNYKESTIVNLAPVDNVYDVIKPKRVPGCRPELVSTGTRAPSPDKLEPYSKRLIPVSEYMEPRDLTVHTYSELPPTRPDLLPGLTRQYQEIPASIVNRPLPAEPN